MAGNSGFFGTSGKKVIGVVLAGGQSRRMGRDKANIRIGAEKNPDLLELAFRRLCAVVNPCFVSHGPGRKYTAYPCIEDAAGGVGPAMGILSALKWAKLLGACGALVTACDLPRLSAGLLRRLLLAYSKGPAGALATFFRNGETGREEMLVAVYTTAAIDLFQDALAAGRLKLNAIIPEQRKFAICYGEDLAPYFLNCNRPEDLGRLDCGIITLLNDAIK